MSLDLSVLIKSIDALDRSVRATSLSARFKEFSTLEQETLKSGVIQAFSVAYEQAVAMMRRWLDNQVGDVDGLTRRELYTEALGQGLIGSVELWMGYHEARNLTLETWEPEAARKAYEASVAFLPVALELLFKLESRNK